MALMMVLTIVMIRLTMPHKETKKRAAIKKMITSRAATNHAVNAANHVISLMIITTPRANRAGSDPDTVNVLGIAVPVTVNIGFIVAMAF